MALTVGDLVIPHTPLAQGQQLVVGVIDAIAATLIDVLWDNGLFQTKITEDSLDKVLAPDAASLALVGQVVRRVLNSGTGITASAAYDATVISIYKRQQKGTGAATADLALLKLLSNGEYQEILVSQLEAVPGR